MTRSCHYCHRPEGLRLKLAGQGANGTGTAYCKACTDDLLGGRPPGSTVARRSWAVKTLPCPHCHAKRGELCHGPGVVRFVHSRRRDAAEELRRDLAEDAAYGN